MSKPEISTEARIEIMDGMLDDYRDSDSPRREQVINGILEARFAAKQLLRGEIDGTCEELYE